MFEIVHDGSVKAYLHICTTGMFSKTLYRQNTMGLRSSISPRLSPMIFDPHANSVLLRAHLCTAVLLLAHLCTAVLTGWMRRTLCSKLFMMRAWRPIYTYVQRESSAEPSMRRTLCDWGVFHLSSVLANHIWSPSKFSALTSLPSYSSTPTSTSLYSGKQYFGEIKSEVIFKERAFP